MTLINAANEEVEKLLGNLPDESGGEKILRYRSALICEHLRIKKGA